VDNQNARIKGLDDKLASRIAQIKGLNQEVDDLEEAVEGLHSYIDTSLVRRGDDVALMQQALNDLGFDCRWVDGLYGPRTMRGVSAFQKANGLPVTGIADQTTLDLLYSGNAKAAEQTTD